MPRAFVGILVGLLLPARAWAEDVGVTVAALNDPQAECRYLAQKVKQKNEAISLARDAVLNGILAMRAAIKAPKGEQPEKLKIADLVGEHVEAVGNLSLRAQSDAQTVEEVIAAKRGSVDQCKKELEKIPPPKEVKVPLE